MSRQLDQKLEERDTAKRDALYKALEYSLPGALEHQGIELRGFTIVYNPYSCRIVIKGIRQGEWIVAFAYSDTMTGCLLSATAAAARGSLSWGKDKYQPSED